MKNYVFFLLPAVRTTLSRCSLLRASTLRLSIFNHQSKHGSLRIEPPAPLLANIQIAQPSTQVKSCNNKLKATPGDCPRPSQDKQNNFRLNSLFDLFFQTINLRTHTQKKKPTLTQHTQPKQKPQTYPAKQKPQTLTGAAADIPATS